MALDAGAKFLASAAYDKKVALNAEAEMKLVQMTQRGIVPNAFICIILLVSYAKADDAAGAESC